MTRMWRRVPYNGSPTCVWKCSSCLVRGAVEEKNLKIRANLLWVLRVVYYVRLICVVRSTAGPAGAGRRRGLIDPAACGAEAGRGDRGFVVFLGVTHCCGPEVFPSAFPDSEADRCVRSKCSPTSAWSRRTTEFRRATANSRERRWPRVCASAPMGNPSFPYPPRRRPQGSTGVEPDAAERSRLRPIAPGNHGPGVRCNGQGLEAGRTGRVVGHFFAK